MAALVALLIMANLIDRTIEAVAPEWGRRRALARTQIGALDQIRAAYDGAARGGRGGFRQIGGSSANTEILTSRRRLVDVARDLDRNNAMAASCRDAWSTTVVGAGIIPNVETTNQRVKTKLQKLIADHLETPAIDVAGRNTLYGIQALVCDTLVRDGECLIVRYYPKASAHLPVPLQVRVLECDYLDQTRNGPAENGNVCFEGIEFDVNGTRVAYWLYDEHPGGGVQWRYPVSRRVPAADVSHVYRVDRPGQARGIPWCAPVVVTMWDLHDYEDAELMRQKVAACFAVFITGDAQKTMADQIRTTDTTPGGVSLETISPAMIKRVPGGMDVKFATPPTVVGFKDTTAIYNRKIATGYGVPYEIATGDLSQVSFISGRLGGINFNRRVDKVRWHVVIPHCCDVIGRWFLQAVGVATTSAAPAAQLRWTPPRRELVDPKAEVPGIVASIRAGITSRSEETRKLGYDPEQVEQEMADENKRADDLGLQFDSDGRVALKAPMTLNADANPNSENPGSTDKSGDGNQDGGDGADGNQPDKKG